MKDFFVVSLNEFGKGLLSQVQRGSANELFFVTSGHVIRDYHFSDIRINKNDIHLSLSGQISGVSGYSDDLQGYFCHFEDSFLEQIYLKENLKNELVFINSFLLQYPLRLTAKVAERLESNFRAMLTLYEEFQADVALIHAYLVASIFEMKKLMLDSHLDIYPSKAFLITKRYNDLLAAHFDQEHSMAFYAQQLNITPNHLNKSVKTVTGRTALSFLNEMRMLDAKMRLKNTSQTINEIAFQLGFEDQSYFTRFFKKATKITPREFRNKGDIKND